ncbi:hypothetical protein containing IHF-like DNA-binding domain [Salinibacter ruber M8]|uniref:DNA-binding protein HU n=2 Tax=Salinibacter ruber TaxID=146919 RepID=D5H9K0_SALRM|nr:hypothetical protein containing IHF-like DNA-binding domain [Salinibacter ruber M8]
MTLGPLPLIHSPTFVMESPSAEDVIEAFTDVVQDQLDTGNAVEVPGLGTFSVEHRPSGVQEEDGVRRLAPPRNEVVFTPEPGA